MNTRFFLILTAQILCIGAIAFGMSYLSDYMSAHQMFGDYISPPCHLWHDKEGLHANSTMCFAGETDWGKRHYVYATLSWTLFFISLARIGSWVYFFFNPKEVKP